MRYRPHRLLTLVALLLVCDLASAPAQSDPRGEANLGVSMSLVRLEARRLDAARLPIPIQPQVNPVRIRLRLVAQGATTWAVIVEDLRGRVVETVEPAEFTEGEYWTDEVASGTRLWLRNGDRDTHVDVDAYAVGQQLAQPQGIYGDRDESKLITDRQVPAPAKVAGSAVARIKFMTQSRGVDCTGFLVGADLLMTNHHCISRDTERASARVQFGIDTAGANGTTFKAGAIEATDRHLDFTLLRLTASAAKFGRFHTGPTATKGMWLYLIQHPDGRLKKVAFPPWCGVVSPVLPGVENRANDFGHTCDTLGGSSGSPIIDERTGTLVGLHHWTLLQNVPNSQNQGIQFGLIVEHLTSLVASQKLPKTVLDELLQPRPLTVGHP